MIRKTGVKGFFDQRTGKATGPHGIRSSFRDWVAERTDHSREIAEMDLSHEVGSDVDRAYLRTDMVEKRRQMMTDWALCYYLG
jgi:integrase